MSTQNKNGETPCEPCYTGDYASNQHLKDHGYLELLSLDVSPKSDDTPALVKELGKIPFPPIFSQVEKQ